MRGACLGRHRSWSEGGKHRWRVVSSESSAQALLLPSSMCLGSFSLPTCLQGNGDRGGTVGECGRELGGCTFLPGASWLAHCFPSCSPQPSLWLCLQPLIFIPQSVPKLHLVYCPAPRDCPLPMLSCLRQLPSPCPTWREVGWRAGLLHTEPGCYKAFTLHTEKEQPFSFLFSITLPSLFWPGPGNSLATVDSCPRFIDIKFSEKNLNLPFTLTMSSLFHLLVFL